MTLPDPDDALERAQRDAWWIPPDATAVGRDEVSYVWCPRDVPYLNKVNALDAPAARLPALVDEVRRAHAGRLSTWQIVDRVDTAALRDALRAGGYAPHTRYHTFTLPADAALAADHPVHTVSSAQGVRDAQAVADAAFDIQSQLRDDEIANQLRLLASGRVTRVVAYVDGQPVAAGGLNAFRDLGLGMLWGGCVVPDARGRGLYRAVLAARLEVARALGLPRVGLYANRETSGPIVEALGFRRFAGMTSWTGRPPAA